MVAPCRARLEHMSRVALLICGLAFRPGAQAAERVRRGVQGRARHAQGGQAAAPLPERQADAAGGRALPPRRARAPSPHRALLPTSPKRKRACASLCEGWPSPPPRTAGAPSEWIGPFRERGEYYAEIRLAWRRLVLQNHPDKQPAGARARRSRHRPERWAQRSRPYRAQTCPTTRRSSGPPPSPARWPPSRPSTTTMGCAASARPRRTRRRDMRRRRHRRESLVSPRSVHAVTARHVQAGDGRELLRRRTPGR